MSNKRSKFVNFIRNVRWTNLFGFAKNYPAVIVTLIAGALLTTVIFLTVYHFEKIQVENMFVKNSEQSTVDISDQLNTSLLALKSLAAFYDSSVYVSREEFKTFVTPLLKDIPSLKALEWIPRVKEHERAEYVKAARKYFPNFQITVRNEQGKMVKSDAKSDYYPVYYMEPYLGNEAALGFDLASNKIRLTALEKARDTGKMIATAPIVLVQKDMVPEKNTKYGVLVYVPIYKKNASLKTVQDRRKSLLGFVLAVYETGKIIEHGILVAGRGIKVEAVDFNAAEDRRFIYCANCDKDELKHVHQKLLKINPLFPYFHQNLAAADRTWHLQYFALPQYYRINTFRIFLVIFSIGILFTLILALYLFHLKHSQRIIRESENRFRLLIENMSSAVAVYEAFDNGKDFIFKSFNRAGEQIEGVNRHRVLGKKVTKVFPGVKDFGLFKVFKRVYKTGKPERFPVGFYIDDFHSGWRDNYVYKLDTGEVVAVYDDLTEKKQAEEKIAKSLQEKEVLLQEVYHRVKNNLQMIISLLQMQINRTNKKVIKQALEESQARLKVLGILHEKLYKSKDFTAIDIRTYVEEIVQIIADINRSASKIAIKVNVDKMSLTMSQAMACGFIITELVANALKHAFAEKQSDAVIAVNLGLGAKNKIKLEVKDNGVGFASGFDWKNSDTFGLKVVQSFVENLNGKMELIKGEGVDFVITFMKEQLK